MPRVEQVIKHNFAVIASKAEFLKLTDKEMEYLIDQKINAREIDIFNAYVKWADHQLLKKDLEVTDANRRQVMTGIELIRFPNMSMDEFVNPYCLSNILTAEEKLEIMLYINYPEDNLYRTKFSTSRRY